MSGHENCTERSLLPSKNSGSIYAINNISFRRQHPIGPYITDFCAPGIKLIIELDGSQHLKQTEYDNERTAFLQSQEYWVLRFWNNDVTNNINSVLYVISLAIDER